MIRPFCPAGAVWPNDGGAASLLAPRRLALWSMAFAAALLGTQPSQAEAPRFVQQLSGMPLCFEANRGQCDEPVDFVARSRDLTVYLTGGDALLALRDHDASEDLVRHGRLPQAKPGTAHFVRVSLAGGTGGAKAKGEAALAGRINYLVGNDAAAWHADVPAFAKVRYADVYPGIDIIYYGNDRQLEYDFVVAPGADPSLIELRFAGADRLEIDANGNLVLHVGAGQLRHHKPIVYQTAGGVRHEVAGKYRLKNQCTAAFELGAYDRTQTLIIDPWLNYSTYLGGGRGDNAWAVAADAQGRAYIAGDTLSIFKNLPLSGQQTNFGGGAKFGGDGFVARIDFDGTNTFIGYLTYLGGNSLDGATGIAIDSNGLAYVTGYTLSTNFPVVGTVFQSAIAGTNDPTFKVHDPDAFVTKLDTNGFAVYSTYLGGEAAEVGADIAVDNGGNAWVVGYTDSALIFRATNWVQTTRCTNVVECTNGVCVTNYACGTPVNSTNKTFERLIVANTIVTNRTFKPTVTKISGTTTNTKDAAIDVIVDTTTFDFERLTLGFPVVAGFQTNNHGTANTESADLFVSKISPDGSTLLFSTYLGGAQDDFGTGIGLDSSGNAVISGWTDSTDFPVTNAFQRFNGGLRDAIVARFDSTGANLIYSTYLGGTRNDLAYRVAVDAAGAAYVTGLEGSTDFPSTPGALNGGGVFGSTNLGAAWNPASTGFTHGTINALAAAPGSPGTFYAGGPRGVFKTVDGGNSWAPVSTGLVLRTVLSLAIDPSATETVYAGTSGGLFISTNGGFNWRNEGDVTISEPGLVTTLFGLNSGLPSRAIRSIYIDPADSTNVLVGTSSGVYYRTAFSNEFSNVQWFPLNTGLKSRSVFALAVHPTLPSTLFAATDAGIHISTNLGTNWHSSSSGLVSKRTRAIAIDPVTPSTIYAGALRGFHKSMNGGSNWFILTNGLGRPAINAILVDPSQPSTLYAGATNGLFKSIDGGSNWVNSSAGLQTVNVGTLAFDPNSSGALLAGTRSTNFAGGSNDVFVVKFAPDGQSLDYALTFGGKRGDEGWAIAVDTAGSAFVTGLTLSRNFPVTNASDFRTNYAGKTDAFIAQIDPGGTNLAFSTYWGGKRRDVGQGIALDGVGNLYVVGRTGGGLRITNNTVQAKFGSGGNDAFVSRLMLTPPPPFIETAYLGEEVVVSWLGVSPELVLESKTLGEVEWVPISQKPTLAQGRYSVRLPKGTAGRLFRLRAGH